MLDTILKNHPQIHAYDYFDADEKSPDLWILDTSHSPTTGQAAYVTFILGPYGQLWDVTGATPTPVPLAIKTSGPLTWFTGSGNTKPTIATPSARDFLLAIGTGANLATPSSGGWTELPNSDPNGVAVFYGTVGLGVGQIPAAGSYNFNGAGNAMQLLDLAGVSAVPMMSGKNAQSSGSTITTDPMTILAGSLNFYALEASTTGNDLVSVTPQSVPTATALAAPIRGQQTATGSAYFSFFDYQLNAVPAQTGFTFESSVSTTIITNIQSGSAVITVK